MQKIEKKTFIPATLFLLLFCMHQLNAQNTQIRGFVDVISSYQDGKVNFGLGEQDLFITSEISDRISFLGESVFKYSAASPTLFDVSVERVIIKYNYIGNHNILIGKHHTPVNYWNDTYHHGRVFFPTIERPLLFAAHIIPLHTTGVSLQGQNLGSLRFGYDLMVGNGLGSGDLWDNDKYKSLTAAAHLKPVDGLRIGASYYSDVISQGAKLHDTISHHAISRRVNQKLLSSSIAYFGKRFEFLAEMTWGRNYSDIVGNSNTVGAYGYAGIKIKEYLIPYVRIDNITFENNEIYFQKNNSTSFITGIRYEINYLAVVKIEYQHHDTEISGRSNKVAAQFAIGF